MAGLMTGEKPRRDHGWARTLIVAGSAGATHHIRRQMRWRVTPLLPSTPPEEAIANFGKRATIAVTGRKPFL
jgi:hypothetical protein